MRRFLLLLFVFMTSGCVGCDDDCDDQCTAGQVCLNGSCVSTTECPDGCPDGLICVNAICTERPGECETQGQVCDPQLPETEGFMCLSFDGVVSTCMERCGLDGSCSTGSLCFYVESQLDPICTTDANCQPGQVCQGSQCRDTICQPSECEGALEGQATCDGLYAGDARFPNGATCAEIGNGASFCFPAGPKTEAESCVTLDVALSSGDIGELCAPGLACLGGECRLMCSDNADCGESTCLLKEENIAGESVGFCGTSCEPFDSTGCGPNRTCLPLSATDGLCVPSGNLPAFSECDPNQSQCVDGTTCVIVQEPDPTIGVAGEARCYPVCDIRDAPAEIDGSVSASNQALRDAGCPNPAVEPAALSLVHLAEALGALDVYVGDMLVGTVDFGARLNSGLVEIEAGMQRIDVRPSGAPSTDAALATLQFDARAGVTYALELEAIPNASMAANVRARELADVAGLLLVHRAPDLGLVDIIAVPVGEEPNGENQTILAVGLDAGSEAEVSAAGVVDVLVYPTNSARTSRFDALVILELDLAATPSIFLAGTAEPLDSSPLSIVGLGHQEPRPISDAERYVCAPLGNAIYGYCQKLCRNAQDYNTDYCGGTRMGCSPQFVSGPDYWASVCQPVGMGVLGDACSPQAPAQCGEGLYCHEYGNAAPGFDPSLRGRCEALCSEDGSLACGAEGQDCKTLSSTLDVGQCAVPCEPTGFGDSSCPAGQNACLPQSSLELAGVGDVVPVVREEQSYCSAAGLLAPGDRCSGADCVPDAECLYPRSTQTSFVFSLLSPYVGASGQVPTCTLRCDPFSNSGCAPQETCLFNYPYNADVGHCAPIVENVGAGQSCTRPGESCGPDSICVADAGVNICYRFCQYEGGNGVGGYTRSTCLTGTECAPLINNLGVCRDPR